MISPVARRLVVGLLRESVRGRGKRVRALVGWSAVRALPALLSGRLVAEAIDRGFLAHRTGEGLEWLAVLAVVLLIGTYGTRKTYLGLASVVEPFRDMLVTKAVRAALREATQFGARADKGAVGRITRHIEIAREAYASVFMILLTFALTTLSALIGLVSLIPVVLPFVLGPLIAGLGLFLVILRRTATRRREALLAEEGIAESTSDFVSGIRDVVASGAEATAAAHVDKAIDEQAAATFDVARFTAVQTFAIAVGGWLPLVLILAAGSWLRGNGASVGAIVGALTYVLQAVQPAVETLIRGIGSNGLWLFVTLDRLVETIGDKGDHSRSDVSQPTTSSRSSRRYAAVELRGVTFGYGPEPIVHDLDLRVPHGDHLAIVGPSGVGKSTLAGLMSGILVPQRGEIRLGSAPVGGLDPGELADLRALIPQETYVFEGTLWENLVYLRPDAKATHVDRAVRALGLGAFVERLGGYGADLAGASLSAGERQLITLARAYISPARLVILDEATCHLDPIAEARVETAFSRRSGTLVVIAHRISSARRATRLLVMDGTRITLGTHDSLVVDSTLYRDLVGHWTAPVPVSPDAIVLGQSRPNASDRTGSRVSSNGNGAGAHRVCDAGTKSRTTRPFQ